MVSNLVRLSMGSSVSHMYDGVNYLKDIRIAVRNNYVENPN